MKHIATALVGLNHPHSSDWQGVLPDTPELSLVASYDPDPATARALLHKPYAALPVYGSLDELLARHAVEAAIVLLPLDQAEAALLTLARAGVHVMAEKPVVRTAPALRQVKAALRPGAVFYSGYCWRWDAIINQARALVAWGILGELWSVELRWFTSRVGAQPGRPAHRDPRHYLFHRATSQGGMLQWLGCHWIDVMLHITGQSITGVTAMVARQTSKEIDVEDTASCLLRFGNGMIGSLVTGYLLPTGTQACLHLRGSRGWLEWEWGNGRTFTVHSEHPSWRVAPTRTFTFPAAAERGYGGGTGAALLHDFARCIAAGGADPEMTIDDAVRVLDVLDAAYASAETGALVMLKR